MSDSEILMGMTAPVTVLALQAGATALADNPRLRELNAQLGEANTALAAELAELTKPPPDPYIVQPGDGLLAIGRKYKVQVADIVRWSGLASDEVIIRPGDKLRLIEPAPTAGPRFPGDPGTGRILLGVATAGGKLPRLAEHETVVKKRLVRRRYLNAGMGDLGAPIRAWITEDHKAGRIPAPSIKPGPFGTVASGQHDAAIKDFIAWCEKQPMPIFYMEDHEPENNLKGQPADVQHAGAEKFRADQQHMRALIDEVTGGDPKRLSFGGSLMGWNWAAAAHSGSSVIHAMPPEWNPGTTASGRHVWDWCGIDQYAQRAGGPILDTKWNKLVPEVASWGVPLAVTELGIRSADPKAGEKLTGFVDAAIAAGAVMILYYDSDANSTGEGWILDDRGGQLTVWRGLFADSRIANGAA